MSDSEVFPLFYLNKFLFHQFFREFLVLVHIVYVSELVENKSSSLAIPFKCVILRQMSRGLGNNTMSALLISVIWSKEYGSIFQKATATMTYFWLCRTKLLCFWDGESILIASNNGTDTSLCNQVHKRYNNQDLTDLCIDITPNKAKIAVFEPIQFSIK